MVDGHCTAFGGYDFDEASMTAFSFYYYSLCFIFVVLDLGLHSFTKNCADEVSIQWMTITYKNAMITLGP